MRRYGNYARTEGILDSRLIVIAAEGERTEKIYFEALRAYARNSRVHIRILERDEEHKHDSAPEYVLEQLMRFKSENALESDDELWWVIDRDNWKQTALRVVAQKCVQDDALHLALSNPCFELWLMLHLEDVASFSDAEKERLFKNKREGTNNPYIKRAMRRLMGGSYNESHYNAFGLVPHVREAILRAESLDAHKKSRWPQELGTRVYLLAESILRK